jgi:4-hydroxybenzoate polyprenyltransferase
MKELFIKRFYIYQKERFPFIANGILIAIFTFSAISYSRICRGADGFISLNSYLIAIFTTITLFFLLRIFDEFKDKEEDAKYRSHLPVPRGLVSLRELAYLGIVTAVLQILFNILFYPKMLILYFAVIVFLLLMGKEFFVARWLKKHPIMYVVSHMFIIPLIDIYASGMDWLIEGVDAPHGLLFFFAVSYMNGVVLEFGRKIKVKENEEFNTYSTQYGANKATVYWIIILAVTLIFSIIASSYAGYGKVGALILVLIFMLSSLPGFLFLRKKTLKLSKLIEVASGFWTAAMYLTLGGFPMLYSLVS